MINEISDGAFYGASPLKRKRRTKAEIQSLLETTQSILAGEDGAITIRHLFYRLVGVQAIEKTQQEYKNLNAHLTKWRRAKAIPYDAFADNTRWHVKRRTFDSMDEALQHTVENYRRNLWADQPYYVELSVEKDAICSVVADTANSFGVPVFVVRGFGSLSGYSGAGDIYREAAEAGKEVIIYHLGDHDPSGVAISEVAVRTLKQDFGVDVQLIRAAVTPEQIEEFNLPTREPKAGDSRSKKWTGGGCVDVDALPASFLRQLVEDCITQHIDVDAWRTLKQTEKMERETLRQICGRTP